VGPTRKNFPRWNGRKVNKVVIFICYDKNNLITYKCPLLSFIFFLHHFFVLFVLYCFNFGLRFLTFFFNSITPFYCILLFIFKDQFFFAIVLEDQIIFIYQCRFVLLLKLVIKLIKCNFCLRVLMSFSKINSFFPLTFTSTKQS
jgi:hypothetical protein